MRRLLALFLVVILLASHDGASGVIPHAEMEHAHQEDSHHVSIAASNALEQATALGVDLSDSAELAPSSASHTHVAGALLEPDSFLASNLVGREAHQIRDTPSLMGREIVPTPQPPSA